MSTTTAEVTQVTQVTELTQTDTNSPKTETVSVTTPKSVIAPEFAQAISDSFDIIAQTYDLKDNQEVFDFVRQTLMEQFAHVAPREIKVPTPGGKGGKGRSKKVAYNLYISSRFAENKKDPAPGKSTTDLMTQFSKEWKDLKTEQKQPFEAQADQENAKLFPEKVGKQKL